MSTVFEPPPLLAVAMTAGAAAAAMWVAMRGSRAVAMMGEDDEVWGAAEPAMPQKQPYVYPTDRREPLAEAAEDANGTLLAGVDALQRDAPDETVPAEPGPDSADDDEPPSLAELYRRRAARAAAEPQADRGTAVDTTAEEER